MPPHFRYFDSKDPEGGDTHRIAYQEWDSPHSRTTLCVHGLTRNSHDFDFFAESLSRSSRVICPDVAGRGESQWLKNPRWYNYGVYYEDMLGLLGHVRAPQCDWVGTSMGGIIGMMVASLHPERVRKLVLNDIGSYIPKAGLQRIAEYAGKQMEFPDWEEAERYLRVIFAPFHITDPGHWQHVLRHSLKQEPGYVRLLYDPTIAEAFKTERASAAELTDVDLWPLWEKIQCPVLILRGENSDILLHETAARMALEKKNTTLIEIPIAGHAPMLMEDTQIKLVQDWLEE